MTRPLNPASSLTSSVHPKVQQETLQELERTYGELNRVRKINVGLKESYHTMEKEMETLREKVRSREQEIERLGRLFEGGQHLDQLKVEYVSNSNAKTITKLQHQLDFLNRENHRLEAETMAARAFVKESRPGFKGDTAADTLRAEVLQQRQVIAQLKNALMFK